VRIYFFLMLLLIFCSCKKDNTVPHYSLSYFFDRQNKYTPTEIIASNSLFRDTSGLHFNFNHSRGTVWIAVKITNNGAAAQYAISTGNLFIDRVAAWQVTKPEIKPFAAAGLFFPENKEAIMVPAYSIVTAVGAHATSTVYISFQNSFYRIIFDLGIETEKELIAHTAWIQFQAGLFSGVLTIIFLFNLLLFAQLKDNIYLFYGGYCFTYLLYIFFITGYPLTFSGFYPGQLMYLVPPALLALSHFLMGLFANRYLNIKKISPLYYRLLLFSLVNLLVFVFFYTTGINNILKVKYYILANFPGLLTAITSYYYIIFALFYITILLSCIKAVRQNNFLAKLYLAAFIPFITLLAVLAVNQFFHVSFNVFNFIPYAGLLEIVLMAVALSFRIKYIQTAKQKLEVQILKVEITERQRIARDLHDDLGASLSAAKLLASLAEQKFSKDDIFTNLRRNIQFSISNLRQMIWNIDETQVTFLELFSKINLFSVPLLQLHNIDFTCAIQQHIEDYSLQKNVRNNLYLILKEVINNAAKYSQAALVSVNIYTAGPCIAVEIKDNGRGFDTTTVHSSGNGLNNLRTRAIEIHGKVTISTAPGCGTIILLEIPVSVLEGNYFKP
jgi:signal transduction histidine kinase